MTKMFSMLTKSLRQAYQSGLEIRAAELGEQTLSASALVFAPHPDDEVLGVGGTIIKKLSRGADVDIVFMTDGSRSHPGRVAASKMREVRRAEALEAGQRLGVAPDHLHFLDFADGALRASFADACRAVQKLLRDRQPSEVFVPYRHEPPDDHAVTREIVLDALGEVLPALTVYEYPVWYWAHWPMVRSGGLRSGLRALKSVDFAWPGFKELRTVSSVQKLVDKKRNALDAYASQMTRPEDTPEWITLSDVADGDFLACFFSGCEYFKCYQVGAEGKRP